MGPTAPFDAAICCLSVGAVVISLTWTENYGQRSKARLLIRLCPRIRLRRRLCPTLCARLLSEGLRGAASPQAAPPEEEGKAEGTEAGKHHTFRQQLSTALNAIYNGAALPPHIPEPVAVVWFRIVVPLTGGKTIYPQTPALESWALSSRSSRRRCTPSCSCGRRRSRRTARASRTE